MFRDSVPTRPVLNILRCGNIAMWGYYLWVHIAICRGSDQRPSPPRTW